MPASKPSRWRATKQQQIDVLEALLADVLVNARLDRQLRQMIEIVLGKDPTPKRATGATIKRKRARRA